MATGNPIIGRGISRSGCILQWRVVDTTFAPITTASLSSITYSIRDLTLATTVGTGSLTIATVVYNQLQLGNGWNQDSLAVPGGDGLAGFNFMWVVPASLMSFSSGPQDAYGNFLPHKFQVDVLFTPVLGQPFEQSAIVYAQPAYA